MKKRVGLVGARGYVGRELVQLVEAHPELELGFVASKGAAGQLLSAHMDGVKSTLAFEDVRPEELGTRKMDVYVLALSNGESKPWVEAISAHAPEAVVVDISADHRFHKDWAYGLPEHHRAAIKASKRISNPGCYATAAQVALWPVRDLLAASPHIFGISGYSGAGATPSPRNDVNALRDNVMPYALVDHMHEREIGHHLGRPVFFMPHVAPFFRGMVVTVSMELTRAVTALELHDRLVAAYRDEPLVKVQKDAPLPRDAVGSSTVQVGGIAVDGKGHHAVVCAALDNLLKGAASQAMQNLNLALGFPERMGLAS